MKEKFKVGNRLSCKIEQAAQNFLLLSYKSSGVCYRGVLINENCSTVQREIPDGFFPKKALLSQETTDNLIHEITHRDLDTTSKSTRSKKLKQSCIVLDDYDLDPQHTCQKSPIDSIRGLVESINSSKELALLPLFVQNKEPIKPSVETKWLTRRIEPKPSVKLVPLKAPSRVEPKSISVRKDIKLTLNKINANKLPLMQITKLKTNEFSQSSEPIDNISEKSPENIPSTEQILINQRVKSDTKVFSEFVDTTPQNEVLPVNTHEDFNKRSLHIFDSKKNLINAYQNSHFDLRLNKDCIVNKLTEERKGASSQVNPILSSSLVQTSQKNFSPLGTNSRLSKDNFTIDVSKINEIKGKSLPKIDSPKKVPKIVITKGKRLEQVCRAVEKINLANSKTKRQLEKTESAHELEPPKKTTRQQVKVVDRVTHAVKETSTNILQLDNIKDEIPKLSLSADRKLFPKVGIDLSVIKNRHKSQIKRYLLSRKNGVQHKEHLLQNQIGEDDSAEKIKNNSVNTTPSKNKSKPKRIDPITIALNNIRKYDSVRKLRGKNLRSTFNLDDDILSKRKKRRSLRASAIAKRKALAQSMKPLKSKVSDSFAVSDEASSSSLKSSTDIKSNDIVRKFSLRKINERKSRTLKCKSNVKSFSLDIRKSHNLKGVKKPLKNIIGSSNNQDLNNDYSSSLNCKLEQDTKDQIKLSKQKKEIQNNSLSDVSIYDVISKKEEFTDSTTERKSDNLNCVLSLSNASSKQSLLCNKVQKNDILPDETTTCLNEKCKTIKNSLENVSVKNSKVNLFLDKDNHHEDHQINDLDLFCHETDLSPEPALSNVPRVKNRRKPVKVFKSLPNPAESDIFKENKDSNCDEAPDKYINNTVNQFALFVGETKDSSSKVGVNEVKMSKESKDSKKNVCYDYSVEIDSFISPKRNLFKLRPRLLPNMKFPLQRVSSVFEVDVEEEEIELNKSAIKNSSDQVQNVASKNFESDVEDASIDDVSKFIEFNSKSEQIPEKKTLYHRIVEQQKLLKPLTRSKEEIRIGDVVWGRCHGYGWWPGLVISLEACVESSSDRKAHVNWLNSTTQSKMTCKDLNLFIPHFEKHFKRKSSKTLKMAVIEAQKACEAKYGIL
ncbi:uncharacterized protein LOC124809150 [Hydra vulgaris]|uniref:Uncharacterized protein LOC124809150 n=1 Tax=Hydra vulgaris TaxID=6087 RepID=A0ABM4BJK3_HYDVU